MKKLAFLVVLLTLSACGFEPLYGERTPGSGPPLAGIAIDPISGWMGQQLKNALEDAFDPQGQTTEKPYRLVVGLANTETPVIVLSDGSIARYNIILVADYQLVPAGGGAPLTKGRVRRIGSYNVSQEKFSTFTSKQDTLKRSLWEVAEGIRMQLASYMAGKIPPTQ